MGLVVLDRGTRLEFGFDDLMRTSCSVTEGRYTVDPGPRLDVLKREMAAGAAAVYERLTRS